MLEAYFFIWVLRTTAKKASLRAEHACLASNQLFCLRSLTPNSFLTGTAFSRLREKCPELKTWHAFSPFCAARSWWITSDFVGCDCHREVARSRSICFVDWRICNQTLIFRCLLASRLPCHVQCSVSSGSNNQLCLVRDNTTSTRVRWSLWEFSKRARVRVTELSHHQWTTLCIPSWALKEVVTNTLVPVSARRVARVKKYSHLFIGSP